MFCRRLPLLVSLALIGCSGYRAPSVAVTNVQIDDAGAEAIELGIGLALSNPNDDPLELQELTYRVSVDGREVYRGRRAAEATLPARGGAGMVIPAIVRYAAADWPAGEAPARVRYTVRGEITYITPGALAEVLFDTGVRRPSAGFSDEGEAALTPAR